MARHENNRPSSYTDTVTEILNAIPTQPWFDGLSNDSRVYVVDAALKLLIAHRMEPQPARQGIGAAGALEIVHALHVNTEKSYEELDA